MGLPVTLYETLQRTTTSGLRRVMPLRAGSEGTHILHYGLTQNCEIGSRIISAGSTIIMQNKLIGFRGAPARSETWTGNAAEP